MSREEIFLKLKQLLSEQFGEAAEDVSESTVARDVVGWDSLAHVVLLGSVEKEFAVKLEFADIISFDDVGCIVNCLEKKLN